MRSGGASASGRGTRRGVGGRCPPDQILAVSAAETTRPHRPALRSYFTSSSTRRCSSSNARISRRSSRISAP